MRCLGARVDWLCVAFRVEFDPGVLRELGTRGAVAAKHGEAKFSLGDMSWSLRSPRAGRYRLESHKTQGHAIMIDERAPGEVSCAGATFAGWTVEVTFTGRYFVDHTYADAIRTAQVVAMRMGKVDAGRIRRVDLCADFQGWGPIARDLDRCLVRRSRASFAIDHDGFPSQVDRQDPLTEALEKIEETYDSHFCEHTMSEEVSGVTVSRGGMISARIYDKTRELRVGVLRSETDRERFACEEKREKEAAGWRARLPLDETERWAGPWEGGRVVRVEFQVRGEVLGELGMRELVTGEVEKRPSGDLYWRQPCDIIPDSIERFGEQVDAVWSYLTQKWLRLVVRDHSRLARCTTDARWLDVQRVVFVAERPPVTRVRLRRSGAKSGQALGSVLSLLASRGLLPDLDLHDDWGRAIPDEQAFAEHLDRLHGSRKVLLSLVEHAFRGAAALVVDDLVETRGNSREALEHALVRWRAREARQDYFEPAERHELRWLSVKEWDTWTEGPAWTEAQDVPVQTSLFGSVELPAHVASAAA